MTVHRHQLYRCGVCGIVAEILDTGAGEPICCGRAMTVQTPNTLGDAEIHQLLIDSEPKSFGAIVGDPPHPMERDHYIQWIEVSSPDGLRLRRTLSPGQEPSASFSPRRWIKARAYCNRHGLWEATL